MDASILSFAGTAGLGVLGVVRGAFLELRNNAADEVAELRSALWEAQRVDPMTGLANRLALVEELAARQAHGGSWSLVRFDLDGFKQVNDTYGHAAGDLVLVEAARRLEIGMPEHGLCVRIHGDEFAMVVPFAAAVAAVLMERVAELVAKPMRLGAVRLTVRTSVGLADGGGDVDPETLMDRADQAVYRSKRTHRPEIWQVPGGQVVSLPGAPAVYVTDMDAVSLVLAGGLPDYQRQEQAGRGSKAVAS
jgi:diguanylate cyclase (GGDEF)-like protein